MGNWPSVNSESSTASSLSNMEEAQEDGSLEEETDEEDEGEEIVDCDASEKSFFSEEEILPREDSEKDQRLESSHDDTNDEEDLYESARQGTGFSLSTDYQHPRDISYDEDNNHSNDDEDEEGKEMEEDNEENVDETNGFDEVMSKMEQRDLFCSLPAPPPPSPYSSSLMEHMPGISKPPENELSEPMQFQEYKNVQAGSSGGFQDQSPTEVDGAASVAPPVLAWEIDVSDLTSSKATKKRRAKRSSKFTSQKSSSKDKKVQPYYPPVVSTTPELLSRRKCLDQSRWFCISRPQYSKSCGLSSLVSCWNYLFSSLGGGTTAPITQEQALTVLGFKPPFGEIRFGPFTGNATLMRWFKKLNDHYGVRGRAYYQYKPHGRGRTAGRTSAEGLHLLKQGLQDPNMAFIYHCYNHYFCPIGFEDVPLKAVDAYRDPLTQDEVETWILIGDPSRRHPGIHCFRWEDISTDLNCQNPEYLNIRKRHLGVQRRRTKKTGGNLHCIMAFCRSAGFLTRPARAKGKQPSTAVVSRSKATLSQNGHSNGGAVTSRSSGELGSFSQKIHRAEESASDSQVEKRLMQKSPRMSGGVDEGQKPTGKKASKTKTGSQSKQPKKSKGLAKGMKSAPKEENLQENIIADMEEAGLDQVGSSNITSRESKAKDKSNLDEVTRFIRDVSTKFGLSLDGKGAQRADQLREAMGRSEGRAANGGSEDTGNEWVLLGKASNQRQSRSRREMGNAPIHLSELRGMDADSFHQVRLDDPSSGTMQDSEVSQVAKHLLDQYLASIIESKAVQQEAVVPPSS